MRVFSWLVLFTTIANAQIPIPDSCKDLAIREGYPLIMSSPQEEANAKSKLALADKNDPLVIKCQNAIKAIERIKKSKI